MVSSNTSSLYDRSLATYLKTTDLFLLGNLDNLPAIAPFLSQNINQNGIVLIENHGLFCCLHNNHERFDEFNN